MRIALYTLGCKVNQYESQAMEALLLARGHHLVPFTDQADVYLINSCTVTATSDKKSCQAVRQARKRAPEALVALVLSPGPPEAAKGTGGRPHRRRWGPAGLSGPDRAGGCSAGKDGGPGQPLPPSGV